MSYEFIRWFSDYDHRPLNRVGLPHYTTQLLSSWTPQLEPRGVVSMPPSKIPEEISRGLKRNENVWYAALPRELRGQRNVVKSAPRKDQARFRSGKSRSSVSNCPDKSKALNPHWFTRLTRMLQIWSLRAMMFQGSMRRSRLSTQNSE